MTLNLNIPEDEWPTCIYPGCTNSVNPKRVAALDGICRCLEHPLPVKQFTVAPAFNKGPTMFISHGDIEDIGK